jgi:plasmid maintenance system antidote protein VapI
MPPGPLTLAISELINDAFLELLISQAEFGELLGGMPQSTVSVYLRGERALDMELYVRMCRVVAIDPEAIFSYALHSIE